MSQVPPISITIVRLTQWVNADPGCRRVSSICKGDSLEWEVKVHQWVPGAGEQSEHTGEGETIDAAIHAALNRAGAAK